MRYRLYGKLLNGRCNGKLPTIQRRVVTAKEEERQRPIQWKVTDDSEARGRVLLRRRRGGILATGLAHERRVII